MPLAARTAADRREPHHPPLLGRLAAQPNLPRVRARARGGSPRSSDDPARRKARRRPGLSWSERSWLMDDEPSAPRRAIRRNSEDSDDPGRRSEPGVVTGAVSDGRGRTRAWPPTWRSSRRSRRPHVGAPEMEADEDAAFDRVKDIARELGVAPRGVRVRRCRTRPCPFRRTPCRRASSPPRSSCSRTASRGSPASGTSTPRRVGDRPPVAVRGGLLDGRLRPPEEVEVLVVEAADHGVGRREARHREQPRLLGGRQAVARRQPPEGRVHRGERVHDDPVRQRFLIGGPGRSRLGAERLDLVELLRVLLALERRRRGGPELVRALQAERADVADPREDVVALGGTGRHSPGFVPTGNVRVPFRPSSSRSASITAAAAAPTVIPSYLALPSVIFPREVA